MDEITDRSELTRVFEAQRANGLRLRRSSADERRAIVVDMDWATPLMTDEIFGPILPDVEYDTIADVAEHIDRTGKPLAVYVFSRETSFVDDVLRRTSSGVTVNDVVLHYAEINLPFGGVNKSGIGRSRGVHGFRELSNAKSVFVRTAP